MLLTLFSWAKSGCTEFSLSTRVNVFSCCGQENKTGNKWSFLWHFPESAQSAPGLGLALEGREQVVAHPAKPPGGPSSVFELMPEFWLVCFFTR